MCCEAPLRLCVYVYFLSRSIVELVLFNNNNNISVSKTFIQNVYDTQYKQFTHHLPAGREKQSDQLFAPLNSDSLTSSSAAEGALHF